jgi:hypothetical protein
MRSITLVPKKLRWAYDTGYVNDTMMFSVVDNGQEIKLSIFGGLPYSDNVYRSKEEAMQVAQEIWDNYVMSLCDVSIK